MVKQLTVSDLVDMAIKDAPSAKAEQTKVASSTKEENKFIKLAETLEVLSLEEEAKEASTLKSVEEKHAQIDEIVKTYIELERP